MAYLIVSDTKGKDVSYHVSTGSPMTVSDTFPYVVSGSQTLEGLPCAYKNGGSVQVTWSGADKTDATGKIQVSNNRTDWSDVSGATMLFNAASGSSIIRLSNIEEKYVRFSFTYGTNTTGTFDMDILLKSRH